MQVRRTRGTAQCGSLISSGRVLSRTISVEVLPDPNVAAEDLGFLNLANTLGGVGGSFVAASVIGRFGYGAVFAAEAVMVLLAGVLFYSIRRLR